MSIIVEKADFIHYDLFILHFVMCFIDVVWLKFPAVGGCHNGSDKFVGSFGYYWSSSLSSSGVHLAPSLFFYSSEVYWGSSNDLRYYGMAVRGVVG